MMIDLSKFRDLSIKEISIYDIRFPTSKTLDGSDAMHTDPDYSCAYVILSTENAKLRGHGFSFTLGKGTEIVVKAIEALCPMVRNRKLAEIIGNFRSFCRRLTNESQLRWLGPEKGVTHLAAAAVVNSIWDLWAKIEGKPVWKLLVDMEPSDIIGLIDFKYISDALTEETALDILTQHRDGIEEREKFLLENGLPAYITSVGWIGYNDEKIKSLCNEALKNGWTRFKMKVGRGVEDDVQRAELIRSCIGYDNILMMDANQVWDVDEAVQNMEHLHKFKPLWIEEPTSPDDILGQKRISDAIKKYGIGVASGEHCHNKVMFKQFMKIGAMQFCQIDACRVAGINEILAILLLAAHFKIPVCPHAGGVGLCELVVHLAAFNYICIVPHFNNTSVEFADHLHEHFIDPAVVKNGQYVLPKMPGYSCEMKRESIESFKYPSGNMW